MAFHTDDSDDGTELVGHTVVDPNGQKIGKVADVLRDAETGRPQWAVIDLGKLKASHYAPLTDAYKSVDDTLVINLEKRLVASAPKASAGEHVLTPELEAELRQYYATA
jgi:sporulation protein YlmC with PRC-barrel domain